MRKCKGEDELSVLEVSNVGVITRAKTRKLAIAEAKRKQPEIELHSSCKNRRRDIEKSENSVCSSNGSSELVDNISLRSVIDLEDSHEFDSENSPYRESELHSEPNSLKVLKMEEANSCEKPIQVKMPTEEELEFFFSAAEKELKRQFADKYNYDIEEDVALDEGRYEWIQVKP